MTRATIRRARCESANSNGRTNTRALFGLIRTIGSLQVHGNFPVCRIIQASDACGQRLAASSFKSVLNSC